MPKVPCKHLVKDTQCAWKPFLSTQNIRCPILCVKRVIYCLCLQSKLESFESWAIPCWASKMRQLRSSLVGLPCHKMHVCGRLSSSQILERNVIKRNICIVLDPLGSPGGAVRLYPSVMAICIGSCAAAEQRACSVKIFGNRMEGQRGPFKLLQWKDDEAASLRES